jgi:hypothetical protein
MTRPGGHKSCGESIELGGGDGAGLSVHFSFFIAPANPT